MTRNRSKIIIGIGNPLRRDDGIGVGIVQRLRLIKVPLLQDWTLLSWQGDLFDLIPVVEGGSHVIFIDGLVDPYATPGAIYKWDLVQEKPPNSISPMSTHSVGLGTVVELLSALGKTPQHFWLIGVVLADCGIGDDVSPAVALSMDQLMHTVLGIVAQVERLKPPNPTSPI